MNVYSIDITLEQYFRAHYNRAVDFALRIDFDINNNVRFYIHPLNAEGETLDFSVNGNTVECITQKVNA
jgi:hypothetical protein